MLFLAGRRIRPDRDKRALATKQMIKRRLVDIRRTRCAEARPHYASGCCACRRRAGVPRADVWLYRVPSLLGRSARCWWALAFMCACRVIAAWRCACCRVEASRQTDAAAVDLRGSHGRVARPIWERVR
jgi:hypothetical protein